MPLQEELVVDDVEQGAEFLANLAEEGHLSEAYLLVEAATGCVAAGDAGNEGVASRLSAVVDQMSHELFAYPLVEMSGMHIYGGLPCDMVSRPFLPRMGVGISRHYALLLKHQVGVLCGNLPYPERHLSGRQCPGLKRGDTMGYIAVVDMGYCRSVVIPYTSYHIACMSTPGISS